MKLKKKITAALATLSLVGVVGVVDYTSLENRYDRASPRARQLIETEELAKNEPMFCEYTNGLIIRIRSIWKTGESNFCVFVSATSNGASVFVDTGKFCYRNAGIHVQKGKHTEVIDGEDVEIIDYKIDSRKAICQEVLGTIQYLNETDE